MLRRNSYIGLIVVILLVLFPILPWLFMKPLELRFGSGAAIATSIGQLSALLGLAMFSISLILIARLPFLEKYFGGLDRIWQTHRHLGMLGFLLMLVHPLALAIRLVPVSVAEAALFLVPSFADMARTLGIVALLLMMGIIGATLFAHWRYQILLKTHRFLGLAFMFGVLHAFLIPSDISGNTVLAVYCGVLSFAGITAYLYRTVFARVVPKHSYTIIAVKKLHSTLTEVTLRPTEKPLTFKPGQFVFVSFADPALSKEVHPFSISSAPHEQDLRLTIKALGDWTAAVCDLGVGSKALIEGPFGGFTSEQAVTNKEVWVAGGIGITPFLSRARALAEGKDGQKMIDLYYTTNTRDELVFERELSELAMNFKNFRFFPHVSKEQGYLSASTIRQQSGQLTDRDVYVCGPAGMMKSIITQCKEAGVASSQIHAEEFAML